jgi:hypothetical protein
MSRLYNLTSVKEGLRNLKDKLQGLEPEVYRFAEILAEKLPPMAYASGLETKTLLLLGGLRIGARELRRENEGREEYSFGATEYANITLTLPDIMNAVCEKSLSDEVVPHFKPIAEHTKLNSHR